MWHYFGLTKIDFYKHCLTFYFEFCIYFGVLTQAKGKRLEYQYWIFFTVRTINELCF